MVTKTITVGNSLRLEYLDDQRLYLVTAVDLLTGEEVVLLNLNNDRIQAIAEMEFDGYVDPRFLPIEDFLNQMNIKDS